MIKLTLKIARYCPLVIQGFSNFLALFQVIMANPVFRYGGAGEFWLNNILFVSWLKKVQSLICACGGVFNCLLLLSTIHWMLGPTKMGFSAMQTLATSTIELHDFNTSMVVGMLVPLKGGMVGGIVHPPIGRKNTTYSPCRTWGVKNATYQVTTF